MIREITAVSEEAYHPKTWVWAIVAYSITLTSSATVVGVAAGLLGLVIRTILPTFENTLMWAPFFAALALAYGLRELAVIRLPMPQKRWQVPIEWGRYGKIIQSVTYGTILGGEIFTFIPYATIYALFTLEAILGPTAGGWLGFVYGFTRTLTMIIPVLYSRFRWQGITLWNERISDLECRVNKIIYGRHIAHKINGVALFTIGLIVGIPLLLK